MASLSLYPQFETNLMSNHKVIELLLQLKSAKVHGTNYIKVKPDVVRHLLSNRLFSCWYIGFLEIWPTLFKDLTTLVLKSDQK